GGRSFIPPVRGLEEAGYVDAERFFGEGFPQEPWESLAIIGGGAIGAEFAHIFSAFGTKVSVVEMLPRLVANEEEAVSDMLADNFRRLGIGVYTGHRALSARRDGSRKVLEVRDETSGEVREIRCGQILVAAGIRSNADLLRADLAGIATDERGWIRTNAFLETSQPHIWALGDINGKYQFRHKANYEAGILAHNLFNPNSPKQEARYDAVPWAIFTWPPIAHVGLTQREAARTNDHLLVGTKHYSSVAKGFAMGYEDGGADDGFVKLVAGEDMRILGVHIIGPQADVLIQSFVYLMNAGYRCQAKPPEDDAPRLQSPHTCPGGSFATVGRSMVIHPSLSEVAGWAVGNLDWVRAPHGGRHG
ncbi:MAG TPA: FAD-dependent oxidoreductase, partial [Candidatus Limnocylindria bacterium]|nr:FAD-dependent oxidoreductase [Candidatus Limnocylindria bacterium]